MALEGEGVHVVPRLAGGVAEGALDQAGFHVEGHAGPVSGSERQPSAAPSGSPGFPLRRRRRLYACVSAPVAIRSDSRSPARALAYPTPATPTTTRYRRLIQQPWSQVRKSHQESGRTP